MDKKEREEFAERMKDIRVCHNQHGKQTMDTVAKAIGVGKAIIQGLEDENSTRNVGFETIRQLALHYGVSADYILMLPVKKSVPDLAVAQEYTGLSIDAVKVLNYYASEELPRALLNDYPTVISMLLTSKTFEEILRLLASASGWKKKEERGGFSPNEEGDLPDEYSVEDLKKAHKIVSAVGNTWLSYGEAAEYNTQKAAFLFQKLARQLAGIDPIEPNSDITQTKSFMRYFAEGGAENGSHTED